MRAFCDALAVAVARKVVRDLRADFELDETADGRAAAEPASAATGGTQPVGLRARRLLEPKATRA
jgi:hypothetical protein